MATFVIICRDKPGGLELRTATREAHLAYLGRDGTSASVIRAGPILDDAGSPIGSILTVEAPGLKEVESFAAADPYAEAELFASVEILLWRQAVGV